MQAVGLSIEAIRGTLREHGLHATSARIAVLQTVLDASTHLTADEIRAGVLERYPAVDPATIYRTLETLERAGLIVRVELGDKMTRWTQPGGSHHHMVCRNCRTVVELDDEAFQALAERLEGRYGISVDMHHIVLRGLCRTCLAGGRSPD